jgi:Ubiquitin elongating factor core
MRRVKKLLIGRTLIASPLVSGPLDLCLRCIYSFLSGAQPPNFISDIFYLALATGHYGLQKTLQTFDDLSKEQDEVQRHLDNITADNTWMGVSNRCCICHFSLMSETPRPLSRRGLKLPSNR